MGVLSAAARSIRTFTTEIDYIVTKVNAEIDHKDELLQALVTGLNRLPPTPMVVG